MSTSSSATHWKSFPATASKQLWLITVAQVKSNLVPRVFSRPGNEVGSEVEVEETGKKERNWKDE